MDMHNYNQKQMGWGCSSVGRALASQAQKFPSLALQNQTWWCTPVIPALGRERKVDQKFKHGHP